MTDEGFYVLSVFQQLKGKMARLIEPIFQAQGLTPLQGYVLMLLAQGELTVGALSEQTHMGQSNTSTLCKRLEQAGFLERARSSRDERVVTLSLTSRGRHTLACIREGFARYGRILARLPEDTRQDLRRGVEAAQCALDYLQNQIEGEQAQC